MFQEKKESIFNALNKSMIMTHQIENIDKEMEFKREREGSLGGAAV